MLEKSKSVFENVKCFLSWQHYTNLQSIRITKAPAGVLHLRYIFCLENCPMLKLVFFRCSFFFFWSFPTRLGESIFLRTRGMKREALQVNLFRAGETDFSLTLNTDTRSLGHSFNITNMFPCGLTFCSIVLAQKLVSWV